MNVLYIFKLEPMFPKQIVLCKVFKLKNKVGVGHCARLLGKEGIKFVLMRK